MITPQSFFGSASVLEASAPGRVNLLGEHTDYNDGYVLPIATPMRTTVMLAPSADGAHHFASVNLDEHVTLGTGGHLTQGFGRYIEGCIGLLEQQAIAVPPLRVLVHSDVPIGAGLSSSAALEVAVLRALRLLLGLNLDDTALAQLAQQAEIRYAGVHCGIMDQMAASLCDPCHMLFLDTRTLCTSLRSLPTDTELIVIDCGVERSLAATSYNLRRAECATAARLLGVPALRDIVDTAALDGIGEPYRRRARHVVTENARVLEAVAGADAARFGQLMNNSHASLRDDFEVSIAELDALTSSLRDQQNVFGARMTGAGFGGACVALCRTGSGGAVADAVLRHYNSAGRQGKLLMPARDAAASCPVP